MTFEEYLLERIHNNGLSKDQARIIVDQVKVSPATFSMFQRWGEDMSGYAGPEILCNIIWVSAKAKALEWIEENVPLHWAKGMFE